MNKNTVNYSIPILRIFDETKAREFYIEWLGFKIEFEHRFENDAPIYMGISKDGIFFHLSEHHGDGSPGVKILIHYPEVENYCEELKAKKYKFYHPSVETTFWNTRCMEVCDPFGNKISFYKKILL